MNFEKIKPGVLCKDSIGLFIILKIVNIDEQVKYKLLIYDCKSTSITQTFINFREWYLNFEILS